MHITESQSSFMESNLYLAPPSHPPRRKSPVFYLLVIVDLAAVTVFVLCISRLGKELKQGDMENGGWFKIFSIGYTIAVSIATIIFLTLSVSFFKAVYPAPAPFQTNFSGLRTGAKATIISNFCFSTLWCAGLGIQAGELWVNLNQTDKLDDGTVEFSGVGNDGRFWVRIGITGGIMVGLLILGWCSLMGVWRNKHRRDLANELSIRTEPRSEFC